MVAFMDILKKKIVVFDGSFGALMRNMDIPEKDFQGHEGFGEILNITRPDIISSVTDAYFKAGSDVVQTNTFSANPIKVMEFGLPREKAYDINLAAAKIARKAADKFSTEKWPRFVKGSIGPSGFLPSSNDESLNKIGYDELLRNFYEQSLGLIDGGIDLFIIETQQDLLEVKAAINGAKKAMNKRGKKLPIVAQVTLDVNQNMLLGSNISSVLTTLDCFDIEVIGLNCSTGPKEMTDTVRYLCTHTKKCISVIPNAGLPINEEGKTTYPLKPEEMLKHMKKFVYEFGINIVGSCCGSNPRFIELMANEFRGKLPKQRNPPKQYSVSGGMASVELEQEPKPLIIGETTNATGSRRFLNLLKKEDYESIIEAARAQIESGAHLLDLSVAHNDLEKPEAYYMEKCVRLLSNTISAPLVIDSTDPKVIEAALNLYPGKPMINSINLEGERIHNVLNLVKEFGGAVIGLTIDEEGMAETADKKFEIAKKMYEIYTQEYGLDPEELFIDVLTFPLATGDEKYRDSAIESLKAIERIKKELKGVKILLGVSNISFGISKHARKILNSVYLYHAIKQGLDAAIINSSQIIPHSEISDEEKQLFEDLIFNRHNDALQRVIEFYENKTFDEENAIVEDNLPIEKKLANKIILRRYGKLTKTLDDAMKKHSALDIINDILVPAMKEVGDRFSRGEYILPFVLEAAKIMKKAIAYLEEHIEKKDSYSRGKLVLATVYGDVHDIGKNLVKTIIENNGFTVIDLGKRVPIEKIIQTAKKEKADIIGLSALLVSTSQQMKLLVEELNKQSLDIPVVIGGASVNEKFAEQISKIDRETYSGGVYYAENAFEGLEIMIRVTKGKTTKKEKQSSLASCKQAHAHPCYHRH
ncbi:homocysteine S-methyltransferase family protein [Candidatus Woesearchaeota archaeon]|nr:homocysteine S-methyltransferase family protein [Candidatus Woesearchaeota archaeon]